jgi:hypothetical protein
VGGRALVGTEGALESEGAENGCGRATHKGRGGVRGAYDLGESGKQATPPHSWLGEEELAVDKVRRTEHRKLKEQGEETLKGSKFLFLFAPENLDSGRRARLRDLLNSDLKVGRAWTLREQFRSFLVTRQCQCAYSSELCRAVVCACSALAGSSQ